MPIALGMYESLYEASGNDELFDRFGKQPDTWGGPEVIALLAFFSLIALANSRFAIEPAVKEKNLRKAAQNSFILGCFDSSPCDIHVALHFGAHRYPHRRTSKPDNVHIHHLCNSPPEQILESWASVYLVEEWPLRQGGSHVYNR